MKIEVTCFCTARSVITSRSPMPLFERPSATSSITSRSRGVSRVERVVRAAPLREQLRDDLWIERRAAFSDAAQCCREVFEIGHAVFQEVADPVGGLGEQARRNPHLDVLREDQNPDVRVAPSDLLGGTKPLVGVRWRHPDIDDCHIRLVARDLEQEVVGAGGLSDHVDTGLAEQGSQPVADQQAVIGDHDAHGITAVTVVPAPSGLLMRS